MEGYLRFYHCHDDCHTFLLTWAEQLPNESLGASKFVVTIIPSTQHKAIRNRVENVDYINAERAEFRAKDWITCYAQLIDDGFNERLKRECWAKRIRDAAATIVDVELRSIPIGAYPYAV